MEMTDSVCGSVQCPPVTKCALQTKLTIFMSKIIWQVICLYPIGNASSSLNSNADRTFFISLLIASLQNDVSIFWSISKDCWTDLGNSIPYSWVRLQYFVFVFFSLLMIQFHFWLTYWTHHLKAGSCAIPLEMALSATSKGYEFFMSLRGTYSVVPSFHEIRSFLSFSSMLNPILWNIIYWLGSVIFFMIISSSKVKLLPLSSTWKYNASAIMLARYSWVDPSRKEPHISLYWEEDLHYVYL